MESHLPPFIKTLQWTSQDPLSFGSYKPNRSPVMLRSTEIVAFFEISIPEFGNNKYVISRFQKGEWIWELVSHEYNHYFEYILTKGHEIVPIQKQLENIFVDIQYNPDTGTKLPKMISQFQEHTTNCDK